MGFRLGGWAAASSGKARSALRLIELLEDLDDVQRVTANFEIPDDILAEATA